MIVFNIKKQGIILITRIAQPVATISIVYLDTQIVKYLLGCDRLLQGQVRNEFSYFSCLVICPYRMMQSQSLRYSYKVKSLDSLTYRPSLREEPALVALIGWCLVVNI